MCRLHKITFAILLFPIVLGIVVGYVFVPVNLTATLVITGVAVSLGIVGCICPPRWRNYAFIGAIASFFFLLSWRQTSRSLDDAHFPFPDADNTYLIQITTIPEQKEKVIRCEAEIKGVLVEDSLAEINKRIFLSFAKDSLSQDLQRGDIVLARTQVVNPQRGNPEEFRYDEYLCQHGLCGTAYVAPHVWEYIENRPLHTLRAYAETCQKYISDTFSRLGIVGDAWAVVCALTVGNRDGLDTEMKQHYSAAGAMHVLAVSGLHVGILYGAILFLLTGFGLFPVQYEQKKRRRFNTILLIAVLWIYAFLTGLSASVMRSALMFSLLTVGMSLDRETYTFNTIAASAAIILLLQPLMLFSVSFVLSYSAVIAIVALQPSLQALLPIRNGLLKWLWGLITVSIAAQIGTLPWTMYWFSQTSNWFIFTNIVVVPLAGIILYTAIAVLILAPIPFISTLVAKLLNIEAMAMNGYVEWVESLPYSTAEVSLSLPMLCCLCALIIALSVAFVERNWKWLFPAAVALLLLLWADIVRTKQILRRNELIVYNTYNANVILHEKGRTCCLITDDTIIALQQTKELRQKRCIWKTNIVDISNQPIYVFEYLGNRYTIVRDSIFERRYLDFPEKTDYLLLGNIGKVSAAKILRQFDPDEVILLPTLKRRKSEQLKVILKEQSVPFYDVREKAFIVQCDSIVD